VTDALDLARHRPQLDQLLELSIGVRQNYETIQAMLAECRVKVRLLRYALLFVG
jgi:hypothetical protein